MFCQKTRFISHLTCALVLLAASAQLFAAPTAPPVPISLPYTFHDDMNSAWDIQQDGSVGDGGNDQYDGGGHLFIGAGNTNWAPQSNRAMLDTSRNELIFSRVMIDGLAVSRRISCNPRQNWLRFVEIFENPSIQSVNVQMRVNFSLGSPAQVSVPFRDSTGKKLQIGLAVASQNNFLAMLGGGRGAKVVPRFQPAQGSKEIDILYNFSVPANSTVAIVHLQIRRSGIDQCTSVMQQTKDKVYLAGLAPEVAREVINFNRPSVVFNDQDLLRGDAASDVVELVGGDLLHGNISLPKVRLQAPYGLVELPTERVIGIISAGRVRPRQLAVTSSGEVFSGQLLANGISMQLVTGQETIIPLSSINRIGFRRRMNEPANWKLDNPMVMLKSGDRMNVAMPQNSIGVLTRFGAVNLPTELIRSIAFDSEDRTMPEIFLADRSHFTAILETSGLDLALGDSPGGRHVALPTGTISLLQLQTTPDDEAADAPTLTLANEDSLTASIVGQIKLVTAFDTIAVEAAQIGRMELAAGSGREVRLTLWDGTSLRGTMDDPVIQCRLTCGIDVQVPLSLMHDYDQPHPQPSLVVAQRAAELVKHLDESDWQARERALQQIEGLGPAVAEIVRNLRPMQSLETQQRIDRLLYDFSNMPKPWEQ